MLTCMLKTPPEGELLTFEDVVLHCRIDAGETEKALVERLISAARLQAEGYTRRILRQSVWVYTTDEDEALDHIRLVPCTGLVSASADGEALTADQYDFVPSGTAPGETVFASFSRKGTSAGSGDGTVSLELTAGYAQGACPEAILQWMLAQIGAWYEQRESMGIGVTLAKAPHSFVDALLDPYIIAWSC